MNDEQLGQLYHTARNAACFRDFKVAAVEILSECAPREAQPDDIARVIFANLFPRGMCPADWDSGAILGPGNVVRKQFIDAGKAVVELLAAGASDFARAILAANKT